MSGAAKRFGWGLIWKTSGCFMVDDDTHQLHIYQTRRAARRARDPGECVIKVLFYKRDKTQ